MMPQTTQLGTFLSSFKRTCSTYIVHSCLDCHRGRLNLLAYPRNPIGLGTDSTVDRFDPMAYSHLSVNPHHFDSFAAEPFVDLAHSESADWAAVVVDELLIENSDYSAVVDDDDELD